MDRYAAIIPNRGAERRLMLEWQIQRAHALGYDNVYVVDFAPVIDQIDLYQRLRVGVDRALADNITYCSVIESDDYYSLRYLDVVKANMKDVELLGVNQTMYYHLFSTGWRRMSHPGRSSLFCTTFKTEVFEKLPVVINDPYIDLKWWAFAQRYVVHKLINDDIAVGIKHGNVFGRVGGNGHVMNYAHYDLGLKLLKGLLDKDAFEFYTGIKTLHQAAWNKGQKIN
jgi:hypothetical protein